MESGRPSDDARSRKISEDKLSGAAEAIRQRDSRFFRRSAGAKQERKTIGRRALAGRIQGRDHAYAGVSAGRRATRRPRSGGKEHAVEDRNQRYRHIKSTFRPGT